MEKKKKKPVIGYGANVGAGKAAAKKAAKKVVKGVAKAGAAAGRKAAKKDSRTTVESVKGKPTKEYSLKEKLNRGTGIKVPDGYLSTKGTRWAIGDKKNQNSPSLYERKAYKSYQATKKRMASKGKKK